MARVILHSDLNCFYASAEINENPALRGKKVAVCGSTENRHGIVLTASYPAKRAGVRTGMANWEAEQACPGLIMVPPHYDLYLKYSRLVRRIYRRYCNDIEPFGMDENWLSIDGISDPATDGLEIAEEIRQAVKEEIGLTVSIGVSYNKIFAKLGSDMKKPDAVTVITKENFRDKVWPQPASDLLYVGRATTRKLAKYNVHTIGELAMCTPDMMRHSFGKNGLMLWAFANGLDCSPVMPADYTVPVKSVGHGTTCVRDLESNYEVWQVMYELAQDVGHRLRTYGLMANGVQITIRDKDLGWVQFQCPMRYSTQSPLEIAQASFALFLEKWWWPKPVRALTVRGIKMSDANAPVQVDMFNDYQRREKQRSLDDAIDEIRRRWGYTAIRPASLMGHMLLATDKCETVPLPGLMYR